MAAMSARKHSLIEKRRAGHPAVRRVHKRHRCSATQSHFAAPCRCRHPNSPARSMNPPAAAGAKGLVGTRCAAAPTAAATEERISEQAPPPKAAIVVRTSHRHRMVRMGHGRCACRPLPTCTCAMAVITHPRTHARPHPDASCARTQTNTPIQTPMHPASTHTPAHPPSKSASRASSLADVALGKPCSSWLLLLCWSEGCAEAAE